MRSTAAALLLFLVLPGIKAQDYPHIKTLDARDTLFRQLQDDILQFTAALAQGLTPPPLILYAYSPRKGDDLFSLAARLNLPYDTIATLNSLAGPDSLSPAQVLLVPNMPGIFVPEKAVTDLDRLMQSWRKREAQSIIVLRRGKKIAYRFFPDERFHSLERAYFLGILFRFPLPEGVITSRYGRRPDPFTGVDSFHGGLDIAAPVGTDVLSAGIGTVRETGRDPVLGNYVVLTHFGGYETIYGHLEKVLVQLRQEIFSGEIIGKVGSTGTSTGPHLHFEIRSDGRTKNPEVLLPRGRK